MSDKEKHRKRPETRHSSDTEIAEFDGFMDISDEKTNELLTPPAAISSFSQSALFSLFAPPSARKLKTPTVPLALTSSATLDDPASDSASVMPDPDSDVTEEDAEYKTFFNMVDLQGAYGIVVDGEIDEEELSESSTFSF